MQPDGRLPAQPWMTAPETRAVMAALAAGGAEARFVGGCVRDAAAGRPVKDIDIATPEPPEQVIRLLTQAGLRAMPTGLAHGTVTALAGTQKFEITTLRRDVATDGRHAEVAFTDDWVADAARRDFTMNAMSCAPDGSLFDPFGGRADLAAGHVRFVGAAVRRIDEDVLRLLRFFRFHAYYGAPPPDAEALAACRQKAPLLPRLSGERVAAELLRLLLAPDPAPVVALMRDQDVLPYLLPEAGGIDRLAALVTVEGVTPEGLVHGADAIRRLAALIDGGPPAADAVALRLRLSGAQRMRLVDLAGAPGITADLDRRGRRRLLYALGPERLRDALLLAWAAALAGGASRTRQETDAWTEMLREATGRPPVFPLQGRDALDLGLAPGPEVGRLLKAVESWWIAADFRPGREACLAKLRELAAETVGGRPYDSPRGKGEGGG